MKYTRVKFHILTTLKPYRFTTPESLIISVCCNLKLNDLCRSIDNINIVDSMITDVSK